MRAMKTLAEPESDQPEPSPEVLSMAEELYTCFSLEELTEALDGVAGEIGKIAETEGVKQEHLLKLAETVRTQFEAQIRKLNNFIFYHGKRIELGKPYSPVHK